MKRIFALLILLATFAIAQTDSTDILITIREDGDTTQVGKWRAGMPVLIRDSWDGWGSREKLPNKFVIIRVGIAKARIDSFLVAHYDSTTGLRRKYQLSRAAIQFVKNNRDANNVVRVTPAQLRNAFKRANRLRRFGEPQRMGMIYEQQFIRWRNMLIGATATSATVNTDGGGDYTSLAAAEAGEQKDLETANEQLTIYCSGTTADVTAVTFAGWTTDATRNVEVVGDNQSGYWSNSFYRLKNSLENQIDLDLQYLQAELTTGGGTVIYYNASDGNISNSIFKHTPTSSGAKVFYCTGGADIKISNCIFYLDGSGLSGIVAINNTSSSSNVYIYNCIIPYVTNSTGSATGVYTSHANRVTVKNTVVQSTQYNFSGTFHSESDYNISDNSGSPGANSITASVTFVDSGNENFALSEGSRGINEGTDLSADPNLSFNTDIIGATRPQGSAWDIGAFEYVQPATGTDKKSRYKGFGTGFKGGWKK